MTVTVFLVMIWHGSIDLLIPMESAQACLMNREVLVAHMNPKPDLGVLCYDTLAQTYLVPPLGQFSVPIAPQHRNEEKVD